MAVVEVIVLWVVATLATAATTLVLPGFERGDSSGDKSRFGLLLTLSQMVAQRFIKIKHGAPRRYGRR
jgi:hypothetical protein